MTSVLTFFFCIYRWAAAVRGIQRRPWDNYWGVYCCMRDSFSILAWRGHNESYKVEWAAVSLGFDGLHLPVQAQTLLFLWGHIRRSGKQHTLNPKPLLFLGSKIYLLKCQSVSFWEVLCSLFSVNERFVTISVFLELLLATVKQPI